MNDKNEYKIKAEENIMDDVHLCAGFVVKANVMTIQSVFELINRSNGFVVYKKIVSPEEKLFICHENGMDIQE